MPSTTSMGVSDFIPNTLLYQWQHYLQEEDHSPGTVKKYTQTLAHFLLCCEQEELGPLRLSQLRKKDDTVE